jgi:hypothetical protein
MFQSVFLNVSGGGSSWPGCRDGRGVRRHHGRMTNRAHWKDEPEQHDYPAASDFLSLLLDPSVASVVVAGLQPAPVEHRKAKDLLRASGLALLGPENHHVARDLDKVHGGVELSPVLLVRGDLRAGRPLVVADGYHRICASYYLDENTDIPCKIADLPSSP